VALPVLLASAGVAVDLANGILTRNELQSATDASALATASALVAATATTATAPTLAADFVAGQMSNYVSSQETAAIKAGTKATITQSGSSSNPTYTVKVTSSYAVSLNGMTQILGQTMQTISASSSTTSQASSSPAMSMYLVLDRSGSMSWVTDVVQSTTNKCQNYTEDNWSSYPNLKSTRPCYTNKIAALKQAVATLADQLDTAEAKDTTNTVIRTGAISFTDSAQTPSDLAWGTAAARSYVSDLPAYPTGGTDMTTPMNTAYAALIDTKEATTQASKGNSSFFKYIVLMTDGENTGNSGTWNKSLDTATLATCTSAKNAGITVYTVAFMAPDNGKTMLKSCAGSSSNYYAADDMDDLVAAFKDIGAKASDQITRMTN
jgi:Flp pilus assembly protein TadG